MSTYTPRSAAALYEWLQDTSKGGPGREFVVAIDEDLKAAKGVAPIEADKYSGPAIQKLWKRVEEADIDVAEFTIGMRVYSADKDKWWADQGLAIVKKIRQAWTQAKGGRSITAKEQEGEVLTYQDCCYIEGTAWWDEFRRDVRDQKSRLVD